MALRLSSPTQDPDLEASRAEIEHIEGRKNAAETEMVSVAATSRRIEQEAAERLESIHSDIDLKTAESKKASEDHVALLATHARDTENATGARNLALALKNKAEGELKDIAEPLAKAREEKAMLQASIINLKAEEAAHVILISSSKEDQAKLAGEIAAAALKKAELEKAYFALHAEHVALGQAQDTKAKVVEALNAESDTYNASIASARIELESVHRQIADAKNSLSEIEANRITHAAAMAEIEKAANQRLGNATSLETHVDAKLAQLKEAESQHTTEHLSRLGYKKIGT